MLNVSQSGVGSLSSHFICMLPGGSMQLSSGDFFLPCCCTRHPTVIQTRRTPVQSSKLNEFLRSLNILRVLNNTQTFIHLIHTHTTCRVEPLLNGMEVVRHRFLVLKSKPCLLQRLLAYTQSIKGWVHPRMKNQSLAAADPHADGKPVSGASQQNSAAAFTWTAEVDGDLFYKIKSMTNKQRNCSTRRIQHESGSQID